MVRLSDPPSSPALAATSAPSPAHAGSTSDSDVIIMKRVMKRAVMHLFSIIINFLSLYLPLQKEKPARKPAG